MANGYDIRIDDQFVTIDNLAITIDTEFTGGTVLVRPAVSTRMLSTIGGGLRNVMRMGGGARVRTR